MSDKDFSSALTRYVLGFGLCLLLSVGSYLLVVTPFGITSGMIAALLLGLAAVQLYVQLVCFLHLGTDRSVYSKTSTFLLTIGMAAVIIIGSIWVMRNLDYRMGMSPEAMEEYMKAQNKKGF